jgi:type II secretory pathway component PulK
MTRLQPHPTTSRPRTRDRNRLRHAQNGMALMTTVWISLFLALTAATIATMTRTDGAARRNAADLVRARELAKAGLHLAISDLAQPPTSRRLARDGTAAILGLDGHTMHLRIEDEHGKLDLRTAPRPHVEALFRNLAARTDMDSFEAVTLAQRINALLTAQDPRNRKTAAVQSLGTLAAVPGMTPAFFSQMVHHATLFGFGTEVNPMVASPEALAAIDGMGPREIEGVITARTQGLPRPALGKAERWMTNLEGPIYTVIATGRLNNGIEATITAIVGSHGIGLANTSAQLSILEQH